jgi:hypothetical protein
MARSRFPDEAGGGEAGEAGPGGRRQAQGWDLEEYHRVRKREEGRDSPEEEQEEE